MLDPNKSYRTRSGLAVRNLRINETGNRYVYPWCAEVFELGNWRWKSYGNRGGFFNTGIHDYDLIEIQQPQQTEQPMTLDFTKPESLQTRDGREVRIYATDAGGEKPIHGAVLDDDLWVCRSWTADGQFSGSICSEPCDLIPKPLRLTGWLNCYEMDGFTRPSFGDSVFSTKEEASRGKISTYKCLGQVYVDSEIQP